jgi:hypothetical protein
MSTDSPDATGLTDHEAQNRAAWDADSDARVDRQP